VALSIYQQANEQRSKARVIARHRDWSEVPIFQPPKHGRFPSQITQQRYDASLTVLAFRQASQQDRLSTVNRVASPPTGEWARAPSVV
jgi:hypothetical protein